MIDEQSYAGSPSTIANCSEAYYISSGEAYGADALGSETMKGQRQRRQYGSGGSRS